MSKKRQRFEQEALPLMGVLYAGALKLTRNPRDAEDLVQDTYVRAFERYQLFKPGTNLKAWMFRVMTNRFINLYRRRQARPDGASLDDVGEIQGTHDRVALHEFQAANAVREIMGNDRFLESLDDRLRAALEGLGSDFRDVLVMNVIAEMPYKEIAHTLGVPLGTVMSRLSRAKALLRDRITELGRDEIPGVEAGVATRA